MLSFHFVACQKPHFTEKKLSPVPQPCTGTALKFVSEKNSDEANAFDISGAALCVFSCGKNLSRCAKGFFLEVLLYKN